MLMLGIYVVREELRRPLTFVTGRTVVTNTSICGNTQHTLERVTVRAREEAANQTNAIQKEVDHETPGRSPKS